MSSGSSNTANMFTLLLACLRPITLYQSIHLDLSTQLERKLKPGTCMQRFSENASRRLLLSAGTLGGGTLLLSGACISGGVFGRWQTKASLQCEEHSTDSACVASVSVDRKHVQETRIGT